VIFVLNFLAICSGQGKAVTTSIHFNDHPIHLGFFCKISNLFVICIFVSWLRLKFFVNFRWRLAFALFGGLAFCVVYSNYYISKMVYVNTLKFSCIQMNSNILYTLVAK